MKRENLYLVGGALLASTALTSAATAATVTLVPTGPVTSTTTALKLSAQSFGATPATTDAIGRAGLAVRFSGPLAATFTSTISVTGAKFAAGTVSSNDVIPLSFATFTGSSGGTTFGAVNSMGCAVAFSADNLILASCAMVGTTIASVGGFLISAVGFDNATAMATAGANIGIGVVITVGGVTLDNTAAQNVVTSTNSVTTTVTAGTAANANVNATPAFANLGSTTNLTTIIATISVTTVGTVARDLSTAITTTNAYGNTNNLLVTSTIFSDDAITRTEVTNGGVQFASAAPTAFTGGFVTFGAITAASLTTTFDVRVVFNGTGVIDTASAGTLALTYSSNAATNSVSGNFVAPAAVSGAVAGLNRAGLSIDINGIQPGTAQGARTYTSLLRIANTGTVAGTVAVVLRNDATGATLGTYTSPSIPAGASLQVSAAQVEAGAGVTAVASIGYRAQISGGINGYVQHVNWNQDAGFFSDLSASRNGSLTSAAGK